jgi:hypothetical protein
MRLIGIRHLLPAVGATALGLLTFNKQPTCITNKTAVEQLRSGFNTMPHGQSPTPYSSSIDFFERGSKADKSKKRDTEGQWITVKPQGRRGAHNGLTITPGTTVFADANGNQLPDKMKVTRAGWPYGQVVINTKRNQMVNVNSQDPSSNGQVRPLLPTPNPSHCPAGMVPKEGFID